MFRMLMAFASGLAVVSLAQAHFPFIVPDADGAKAKVVFSDTLEPDSRVNIEKLANTKLTFRDSAGKDSPLPWVKGVDCYIVTLPTIRPGVVFGTTDYGVLQKGEGKPFHLQYHAKVILGGNTKAAILGAQAPLDVAPVGVAGKMKFQVFAAGKPVADSEVTVMLPDNTKKAVKTDAEGFTPVYEQTGRFGVYAKWFEAKSGENAGRKFEEVRHYATLVVEVK